MEWIKIDERKPDKNTPLIVWNGKYVYDDIQLCDNDEFWTHVYGYDYDSILVKDVTHWMYLPEPPKN